MRQLCLLISLILAIVLSACDLIGNDETDVTGTPTLLTPVPIETPLPETTPDVTSPLTVTQSNRTLTIWIPPEIAQRTEAGAELLSEQLFAFQANDPDLEMVIEQKIVSGQGGILNYLRTGSNVAPSVLPDLVALPTDSLATAVADQLIYPIDDLLDDNAWASLYPAAQAFSIYDGRRIAYPFALTNVSHIAYETNVISGTFPIVWNDFTNLEENTFVIPAAGQAGIDLTLQLYLAANGRLVNDAGQPDLQLEPLVIALTQLEAAHSNEFIVPQSSSLTTYAESWQLFQAGTANLTQTTTEQFLQERSDEVVYGFAPIPGLETPLAPVAKGWVWAISTPDPAQKILAAELLTSLVSDVSLGEWSYQNYLLPARQLAFDFWPVDDTYILFIQQQLEQTIPYPEQVNGTMLVVLEEAIASVLSLELTPQAAAEVAISKLQQ